MTQMQRYWMYAGIAALIVFFVIATRVLQPILMPFLAGIMLAYLADPLVDRIEAKNVSRTIGVAIVFVLMSLFFWGALVLLLPLLGRQIDAMLAGIPDFLSWIQGEIIPYIQSHFDLPSQAAPIEELKAMMNEHWDEAGNVLAVGLRQLTSSGFAIATLLTNLFLIPVVTFYLLRDWDIIIGKIRRALPRSLEPTISSLVLQCDEVLSAFLRGQLIVMLCLGLIYSLGLTFVGLNLAILLGTIAGLASVVPYMGFVVGIVVSGVAAYVQFHDPVILLYVAAVFGVGQMLEGMVLTPLLVGDKIGLHPVAVIFAIMAGGQLAGFVGVLLALPVAAIVMVLVRHAHERYRSSDIYASEDVDGSSGNVDADQVSSTEESKVLT